MKFLTNSGYPAICAQEESLTAPSSCVSQATSLPETLLIYLPIGTSKMHSLPPATDF